MKHPPTPTASTSKICSRCKVPSDKFYQSGFTKDGLDVWCKPCRSDYAKARYKRVSQDPKAKFNLRIANSAAQNKYYHKNKESIKLGRMVLV